MLIAPRHSTEAWNMKLEANQKLDCSSAFNSVMNNYYQWAVWKHGIREKYLPAEDLVDRWTWGHQSSQQNRDELDDANETLDGPQVPGERESQEARHRRSTCILSYTILSIIQQVIVQFNSFVKIRPHWTIAERKNYRNQRRIHQPKPYFSYN